MRADPHEAFKTIAAELLGTVSPGKRIAIQPFQPANVPVPLGVAQGFNDALARAIEASPDGTGVVVARDELPQLFGEAEEFGEAAGAQRLLESVRADVLMIGTVNPAHGGIDISYKAFDARTGHQIAASTPQFVSVDLSVSRGLALDQALAVTADALARDTSDLKSVETTGIYYQQSEAETPLGSYIGRELVGRLLEKAHAHAATPAALLRPEGADRRPSDSGDLTIRARPGTYVLSGTLWDLGQDIDVRLALRGEGGRILSYGTLIRRDSIPATMAALAPATPTPARRDDGGVSLQLSSDRGQRPVYAVGDAAHLAVQAARDSYLYCFHQASTAAGGGITTIFPNPYHPEAHIRGGATVHIPDDGMGFALRVYGPAGVEYVRCFASDRDVAARLPPGVLSRDLEPIGLRSLDDVTRIFRNLPTVTVADATLVMTIVPPAATAQTALRTSSAKPLSKNVP